jgi:hypothetical protein
MKKLICDILLEKVICEENEGCLYVTGIAVVANIRNANGRIYPRDLLSDEIDRYVAERVANGSALGTLGHDVTAEIKEDRISHVIQELTRVDDDRWQAKAKVLSTPMGQVVKGIVEGDCRLGFSTRGLGNVDDKGVVSDFYLTSIDLVATPSAPNAYVTGLVESSDTFGFEKVDDLTVLNAIGRFII